MRTEVLIRKLLDFKARQLDCFHMACPRCGLNRMDTEIHRNAYSRHAPVYICSPCGSDEALLQLMNDPLPLGEWATFVPQRIQEQFIDTPADAVWEILKCEQIPYLTHLFRRFASSESKNGFGSYRQAAFESCPGLELLMFKPFYARYEARDGQLVVRFSLIDGEIKVTHEVLPTI